MKDFILFPFSHVLSNTKAMPQNMVSLEKYKSKVSIYHASGELITWKVYSYIEKMFFYSWSFPLLVSRFSFQIIQYETPLTWIAVEWALPAWQHCEVFEEGVENDEFCRMRPSTEQEANNIWFIVRIVSDRFVGQTWGSVGVVGCR